MNRRALALALAAILGMGLGGPAGAESVDYRGGKGRPITLVVRNAPVVEVFEMLAREEQVNVVVGKDVEGEVSVNVFEESVDRAIRAVAEAAGYVAERRGRGYVILEPDLVGKHSANGNTVIRTLQVHYSDPEVVSKILEKHLSRYGELTVMPSRRLVVVEDLPDFVERIEHVLGELDEEPRQILIEAKILEISLEDEETYGIDWVRTFELFDGTADIGVAGLATAAPPSFFFDFIDGDMALLLTALAEDGRVRTLSTPTLLTLEDEEAEVVIGDRLGFRVVTTINEVTSESVEFLESGVILRITASVDRAGRIMLKVHPEVSTGIIEDGLPNQTTTEVTTRLIAEDGQTIFIGGLIKDRTTQGERGLPFVKDIPILDWLVRRNERFGLRAETVVLLTAHVMEPGRTHAAREKTRWVPAMEPQLEERRRALERSFELQPDDPPPPAAPAEAPAGEPPQAEPAAGEEAPAP